MENLITRLHEGNFSCVIANKKEVRTFTRRGIIDLYELQKQDTLFLQGAVIADKVVGKAAAALMVLGNISELYADVISIPALALLQNNNIPVTFSEAVPFIKNRDESDWCPLEICCSKAKTLEDIYPLIEEFVKRIVYKI